MLTPDQLPPNTNLRPLKRSEYERLIELGAFVGERLELIRGALVAKMPMETPHIVALRRVHKQLLLQLVDRAEVQCQIPIVAPDESEPEPDVSVLPPDDRVGAAAVVWLVVEVADSSLRYDRKVKGPLYAEAGIPEYWIVNVVEGVVEVHTEPLDGVYQKVEMIGREGRAVFGRFPDVSIAVADLLP